jgi:transcriptional regulator
VYLPPDFREADVAVLRAAIAASGLATLVTTGPDGLIASHLPLLLKPDPAPFGTLVGHLARPNPQALHAGVPALAIFLGPDAYVSPAWYATKRTTGKVVPTWNYVAIHASGTLRTFDDPDLLLEVVTRLTTRHESSRDDPWSVSDAPHPFIASQLHAIVGIELPIERLEGKWKLSQNRPREDRAGVVAGLRAEGQDALSQLVAERLDESSTP